MESTRPSGLTVVRDRRDRAFPRDVDPNGNPPVGTVGPDVPAGYGDTHVMYDGAGIPPPMVQAWAGWPVEWATPNWGSTVGLSEITRRVSTLFAALDKQAWQIATMPPYRTRDGEVIKPLSWMRNPQPEIYTGWIEAARQIMFSFLGAGEVFLWATSRWEGTGAVRTFTMLNPSWVSVDMDGQLRRITIGGADVTADVLHIRYLSWPGDARGHGPLESAVASLVGAESLERYAANLASRGGIPWGVLESPRNLTAQQATDARSQFVNARMSAMGAPAVMSGGITLRPLTISPKDMALLELRQFDESRISVLLGVPPFLLGLPSGGDALTYSTTESMYDFHWRSALRPFAAMLTEAIGNWALKNPDEALELNRDEYTRPGFGERADAYAKLNAISDESGPAITVDEIRRAERLDGSGSASSVAVPV